MIFPDLSGRKCPCISGWICDESKNVCIKNTELGSDANLSEPIHVTYQTWDDVLRQWLPNVTGDNANDEKNGYVGILGQEIDAVQIYLD